MLGPGPVLGKMLHKTFITYIVTCILGTLRKIHIYYRPDDAKD